MQTSAISRTSFASSLARRSLRHLSAVAALALAGSVMQVAVAAPYGPPGGPGGHGGHGALFALGEPGLAHPRQMEQLFDSIGASAEQRAQIKQIAEAARVDLKAQREAGRQLREQSRALFYQPDIDAGAAEALRQQMLAQHDQASKRVLRAMLDVSRVLTPEQRKAMADRMAERRTMMERHRAERESTAKPTR